MDELGKTVEVSDCGNDALDLTEFDVSVVFDLKVPFYAEIKLLKNLRHFHSVNEHPSRSRKILLLIHSACSFLFAKTHARKQSAGNALNTCDITKGINTSLPLYLGKESTYTQLSALCSSAFYAKCVKCSTIISLSRKLKIWQEAVNMRLRMLLSRDLRFAKRIYHLH